MTTVQFCSLFFFITIFYCEWYSLFNLLLNVYLSTGFHQRPLVTKKFFISRALMTWV